MMRFVLSLLLAGILLSFNPEKEYSLPYKTDDFVSIAKHYGSGYNVIIGQTKFNKGVDIELKAEAEIYAMHDGGVVSLCDTCNRGLGKHIMISENDSLKINYYHLSKIIVSKGDKVKRGQLIGISGSSGLTTVNGVGITVTVNEEVVNPEELINFLQSENKENKK